MPSHARRVNADSDPEPLFQRYGAEDQLKAMYDPVVQLKSGGYLVINPTRGAGLDRRSSRVAPPRSRRASGKALHAHSMKKRSPASCACATWPVSKEIDFIDQEHHSNTRKVEKAMKEALEETRGEQHRLDPVLALMALYPPLTYPPTCSRSTRVAHDEHGDDGHRVQLGSTSGAPPEDDEKHQHRHLHARPEQRGEHGKVSRRAEHVAVHEFPSRLLTVLALEGLDVVLLPRDGVEPRAEAHAPRFDTNPMRKMTIMNELKMENQWIWCSKKL